MPAEDLLVPICTAVADLPFGGRILAPRVHQPPQPAPAAMREVRPLPPPSAIPEVLYLNDIHGCPERAVEEWLRERAAMEGTGTRWVGISGGDEHGGGSLLDLGMDAEPPLSPAVDSLIELGVQIGVPGNHDLDWGALRYLQVCTRYPQLHRVCSNLRDDSPLAAAIHPWLLLQWPDCVVGVVGALTCSQTAEADRHLLPPVAAVIHTIDALLSHGLDAVFLLAHLPEDAEDSGESEGLLLQRYKHEPRLLHLGAHRHRIVPAVVDGWSRGRYLQSGQQGASVGGARFDPQPGASPPRCLWQLRNVDCAATSQEQIDRTRIDRLLEYPELGNAVADTLLIGPHDFKEENPATGGYRGECGHINAVTDALLQVDAQQSADISAVCVRMLSNQPLAGEVSRVDWFRTFPYADRLYRMTIPENCLWQLLRWNAVRLTLPAHYLEARGMLHFSGNLRYRLEFDPRSKNYRVVTVELDGHSLQPASSPQLIVLTHAYVAEGMAGFEEIFAACGMSRRSRNPQPVGPPVRSLLWKSFFESSPAVNAARFRVDQRLCGV